MSVLINFTIFPTDKGESAGIYVAKIIKLFEDEKVNYLLNAMSTNIETETMTEALALVNKAYEVLAVDCHRIYIVLTMDVRTGVMGRMESKVASAQRGIINRD